MKEHLRTVELSDESWQAVDTISKSMLTNEIVDDLLLYLASRIACDDEIKRGWIGVDCVLIAPRKTQNVE